MVSDAGFAMSYAIQAGKQRLYDEMARRLECVAWHQPWSWNPRLVPMDRWACGVDYADKDNPSFGAKMEWNYTARDAKADYDAAKVLADAEEILEREHRSGKTCYAWGLLKEIKKTAGRGSMTLQPETFDGRLELYLAVRDRLVALGYKVDGMLIEWN